MKKLSVPLRIGAIGCGVHASNSHITSIKQIPEMKLAALCDINEESLNVAASRFKVSETFIRYEDMLDKCQLDGICIVGPPSLHVEGARACLKRQIPFMTEKPLSTTLSEARDLAKLAVEYGDCGQVGYTNRFAPSQRLAWRISRLPEFGPVSYVATSHLSYCRLHPRWDKTDILEGFINIQGVHAIDLWRFFGGDPVEVSVSVAIPEEFKKSKLGSILASVRTADGPHGVIHMKAGSSHNADLNSDIMGESSRVRVEDAQKLTYERRQEWAKEIMAKDILADTIHEDQPCGQFLMPGLPTYSYYPDFFRFEWMVFARSLLSGLPLSPSITDSYKTVCLTEAICQSLREGGRPVVVKYDLIDWKA
jgi:predicted dehydrogenase